MSDGTKISQRYRELGAEEPPRALDHAILAAARRTTRPWSRRWAVPLSLAAVVVLSVTVTLRIQHEQPETAAPAPAEKPPAVATAPAPVAPAPSAPAAAPEKGARESKPSRRTPAETLRRGEPEPFIAADKVPPPTPVAAAQPSAPVGELASRADDARRDQSSAAGAAAPQAAPVQAQALAKRAMAREELRVETPERELERIAELRRQGRHEEADKALAEFRKRNPDFRIPDAMLERVERR